MEAVAINQLERFMGSLVEVMILDESGGERSAAVQKTIKKLAHCPDQTHLRIYFDDYYFFAVPLTSYVEQDETTWAAVDEPSGLKYEIRKVCSAHE